MLVGLLSIPLCQGSLCPSQWSKSHACQRSSLAPGSVSRHEPRIASFPPVLSPAGDTQQVLLHLAPRQRGSSMPICATRLDLDLWSLGGAVVRMGQRMPGL